MLRYKESEKLGAGSALDAGDRERTIRCPLCKWQPARGSRWMCSCRHLWNTFDTHGVCPACHRAWRETQCLRCHRWSPHADWYAAD